MKLKLIWVLVLISISISTFAGTSSAGGGVGVRCLQADGSSTLETLDIHEAKIKGLEIKATPRNQNEAIDLASQLLATHYFSGRFEYLSQYIWFMKNKFFIKLFLGEPIMEPDGGRLIYQEDIPFLDLTNDYGDYQILPECHLVQIAYFNDERSVLLINKAHFQEMDFLNQAALFTHEMIYFIERNYKSLHDDIDPSTPFSSELTRFFVGKLYSTNPPKTKLRVSEQNSYINCKNSINNPSLSTGFSVYTNMDGTFSLLLSDAHGYSSPFRISSVIDFEAEDLINFDGAISSKGELELSDYATNDRFFYEIDKTPYQNPSIKIFKNNIALGDFDEVMCILED
ncbi:MAG: hypothetical protein A2381_14050 [Bdellovibrionales bacterium RIFOXYB1_FULL_37_110]|nr:MAG: hypothetical protein A2381_14050 [Bdellovibrionales bacterium RIFOXYB1_FULL_37_110]